MSRYSALFEDTGRAGCARMAAPDGFAFEARRCGEVVIRHRGRVAAMLRDRPAARFLAQVETADDVELQARMARLTGNYKRGNERGSRR